MVEGAQILKDDDCTIDRMNKVWEEYPKLKQQVYTYEFRSDMHKEMIKELADMLVDNIHCAKCPVKHCGMTTDTDCADKIKRIISKRANRKITKKYDSENKLIKKQGYRG